MYYSIPYGNEFHGGDFFMDPEFGDIMGGIAGGLAAFAVMMVFVALIVLALTVVVYVFQSISLYSVAKRRGIHNPWLAWIPIGNMWLLGCISDQYQYVAKGRGRNTRKFILGFGIATMALAFLGLFQSSMMMLALYQNGTNLSGAFMGVFLSLMTMGVSVTACVFEFIALYDYYRSCNPENATVFLVLSILFTITMPFFMFADRKKDLGMPPRAAEPQDNPEILNIPEPAQPEETEE